MQLNIYDKKTKFEVDDAVFARQFNEGLIHQVITAYLAAKRSGTATQKTRAEVKGSGRKPWRQKGTGNARAGTVTSPIWRSGGVTFASKPRSYKQKVNKKMYRGALCVILSELARQDRLIIVEDFMMDKSSTKVLMAKLQQINLNNVLIVIDNLDNNDAAYRHLYLSARNLPNVDILRAEQVTPVALLTHKKVLITTEAVRKLEEKLV